MLEYSKDPDDPEQTRAKDRDDSRLCGISRTTQSAGRNLVETAEWFEYEDQHDPFTGGCDNLCVVGEDSRSICAEDTERYCDDCGEKHSTCQTDAKHLLAAGVFPGGMVLTCEGCCCLSECSNHKISEILKVHGNRASGSCKSTEAVDGCLHEDVCKTEDCSLHGGRNSDFKNMHTEILLQGQAVKRSLKQISRGQPKNKGHSK